MVSYCNLAILQWYLLCYLKMQCNYCNSSRFCSCCFRLEEIPQRAPSCEEASQKWLVTGDLEIL